MRRRHTAPRPIPRKFNTKGSLCRPCFFIVTRLIAAQRLPVSVLSMPSACITPRRSCGQKSSAVPATPMRMPATLRARRVSLRVQNALNNAVISGIVENNTAVRPLEIWSSAQYAHA